MTAGILFGLLFGIAAAAVWMLSLVDPIRSRIDRMPAWAAGTSVVAGAGVLAFTFLHPTLENTTIGPAVIWLLMLSVPVFLIRWLKRPHST
jgi:hypothetical protein